MKTPRKFNEYVEDKIVRKQSPDSSRANSLLKEAKNSYDYLMEIKKKIGITDKNANNIIKDSYDIIMEIIRAKMLEKGFNSSGRGAHEAEVAYLRELGFSETKVLFCNQLRYFRNGMLYYGKSFDKEYAEKVLNFLEEIKKFCLNNQI